MNIALSDILDASNKLQDVVVNTPLQFSERLSKLYSANIYIKREDLQRCRSFKVRGAYNKAISMTETEKLRGIVCASAGNHAQGVAYACATLKVKGVIFMPTTTPLQKIDRVKQFGGQYIEVITIGDTFDDASKEAQSYCEQHNSSYIHPFNDYHVICGQATVGHEIYQELGNKIDSVLVSIGGGGLASGISSYLKQCTKDIQIIGVEPAGAPSMKVSLEHGKITPLQTIDTFVDGAAVKQVGDLTFNICKNNLESIVLVPEGKICTTMIELYQNDGIIVEPAGALSISALDFIKDKIKGKTIVCVLSGGNNDILRYPEIMERSLVYNGRKHYFIIEFSQKPGQLRKLVNEALGPHDDIVRFEYMKKTNKESGAALIGVELYSKDDFEPLLNRIEKTGIHYKLLSNNELLYSYII